MLSVSVSKAVDIDIGPVQGGSGELGRQITFLEFDAVRSRRLGAQDEFLGQLQITLVILADLGHDKDRFAAADSPPGHA